jgi:hypothetical protein
MKPAICHISEPFPSTSEGHQCAFRIKIILAIDSPMSTSATMVPNKNSVFTSSKLSQTNAHSTVELKISFFFKAK